MLGNLWRSVVATSPGIVLSNKPSTLPALASQSVWGLIGLRWATNKSGGGGSKNGRDSQPKMLGVKKYGEHLFFPAPSFDYRYVS